MEKKSAILNMWWFVLSIVASIALMILAYFISKKFEVETSLTAFVAVLGAVPTAYLWVVKERKKEKELQNKDKGLMQQKVTELNKIYVDSINQFYEKKSMLAGAFSLEAHLYNWFEMIEDDGNNKTFISIKIQQICSILFSKNSSKYFSEEIDGKTYSKITGRVISFLALNVKLNKIDAIKWFYFDNSFTDLSQTNISGANLSYANLDKSILVDADLTDSYLRKANLSNANLTYANFSGATLTEANLTGAILTETDLSGTNLSFAKFGGNTRDNLLSFEQVKESKFNYIFVENKRYNKVEYLDYLNNFMKKTIQSNKAHN